MGFTHLHLHTEYSLLDGATGESIVLRLGDSTSLEKLNFVGKAQLRWGLGGFIYSIKNHGTLQAPHFLWKIVNGGEFF